MVSMKPRRYSATPTRRQCFKPLQAWWYHGRPFSPFTLENECHSEQHNPPQWFQWLMSVCPATRLPASTWAWLDGDEFHVMHIWTLLLDPLNLIVSWGRCKFTLPLQSFGDA